MFWSMFRGAEVDLFSSEENSYCIIFFSRERDALAREFAPVLLPSGCSASHIIRPIREERCLVVLVAHSKRTTHGCLRWYSYCQQHLGLFH